MTIAFVSDAIYPYFKGGKEKRLFEMSTRLAKMGNEVHIYCMKWWDSNEQDRVESGVHLHAICRLYPLYNDDRRSIKEGIFFGLACLKLVTKSFDVADVDHMPFFQLYSMWLVCKLKNKPLVASWSEVWGRAYWLQYMGMSGNIAALIERCSVALPSKIVSISPHTTNQLKDKLHCKKPITLIPCGVDLKKINAVKPAAHTSDIIFAGRLLEHKRVDLLVRTVAKSKKLGRPLSCIIIGEGPEKSRLKKLANKLKVEELIEFHDFYENHNDVYALIKASKVFAFPSEREGFGIVVIEANACGKPVVTNSAYANAAKDLITFGYNGYTAEGTVNSFTKSIHAALDECAELEQKCTDFAKGFDWKLFPKKLRETYQ
jgi:glycosyltransferase involved in cell wall biosynthesis